MHTDVDNITARRDSSAPEGEKRGMREVITLHGHERDHQVLRCRVHDNFLRMVQMKDG